MKKILMVFLSLLLFFSLCSCKNSYQNYRLKEGASKIKVSYADANVEEFYLFEEKLESFSNKLSEKLYKTSKDNFVISPVSIYMALAMAIECANDNTKAEMLDAVGVTYDEVLKYTEYVYSLCNNEHTAYTLLDKKKVTAFSKLSNSIWIDDNISLKEECLEVLSTKYNADSYYVPFKNNTKKANKALSDYIYEMTNGLIDSELDFDSETLFTLVNTYYLKEIWNEYGNDLKFTNETYDFINYDSSSINLKLLQGYYFNGKAYEEESFTQFYTKTEHNYKINFIVPKEGYSIDDVFNKENLNKINNVDYLEVDHEKKEINHTRCYFPEFNASYDNDIKDVLINDFNIVSLFNKTCDMTNISDDVLYCDGVIHQTNLTVNKKGIEGAAVTIIPGAGAPGPSDYVDVYYDFIVDRSFGFTITNSNGFILFSGVVKNV